MYDHEKRTSNPKFMQTSYVVGPKEYGPEYAMNEEIVLVTANYRLGVFGFLATEDGVIPGNLGLKDQGGDSATFHSLRRNSILHLTWSVA